MTRMPEDQGSTVNQATAASRLYPVRDGGKVGCIDRHGVLRVPCVFEDSRPGMEDGVLAVKTEGAWTLIDETGRVLFAPRYALVETMHEGRARGFKKYRPELGPSAMIDYSGNEITGFNYNSMSHFTCGRASCKRLDADHHSVIDREGNERFVYPWSNMSDYLDDRACVRIWNPSPGVPQACGFVDLEGNVVVPVEQKFYGSFYDGMTVVRTRDDADPGRLIDVNNRTLYTPGEGSDWQINDYSGGLVYARNLRTDEEQLIDTHGDVVVPPHPEYCPHPPPTGYAGWRVPSNYWPGHREAPILASLAPDYERWGYIDRRGEVVIPFHFWQWGTQDFYEGRAVVWGRPSNPRSEEYGLIDTEGNFVVEPSLRYEAIEPLGGGVWELRCGGKDRRLVDAAGETLWVDT